MLVRRLFLSGDFKFTFEPIVSIQVFSSLMFPYGLQPEVH